jgi:uncharacterized protein (TIRG00374 family)
MRKFIFAVVLMLAVVFILMRTAEVSSIVETLRQADWRFIALAVVAMGLWFGNTALNYWFVYRTMGMDEKVGHLALLISSANFVNIVAPSGGVGGIAVFTSEARRKGISQARVTVAAAMVVMLDYVGFLIVLALGLIVLIRRSTLSSTELVASLIMVTMAAVLGTLLYTGMRSAEALGNLLARIAHRINRILWPFLHREYIAEYRAHEFAHDAAGGLQLLRRQPKGLIIPAALALNGKLLMVLIFWLSFLAFNVPYSPGTIVAGWSISYLIAITTPTPAGIGIVEGILPLTLTTLNVNLGAATVVTLAYRAVTFWLPLFIGTLAFRWVVREEKAEALI